jgi:DtxR family Mn-dependent transcriptional regulator
MADGFHPPLEEYLEAIHALSEEGVDVIQARLVERLGHSAQTVSEMVHRLAGGGYLEQVSAGRPIVLTDRGRRRAESVVRKHRLAERFLVEIVGLPWHRAHVEAGRWEHVISEDVEARFDEILGHPTTCPHGNPIPGSRAELDAAPQFSMAEAEPGDRIRLARITEQVELDDTALAYLSEVGLLPGRDAVVQSRTPDGAVVLRLAPLALESGDGRTVAVGMAMCRQLFVTDRTTAAAS